MTAALTGGVPHPTGYPTYQLLLRLAIALYDGEPARAGAWLSALCAAAAVALLVDLSRRVALRGGGGPATAAAAGVLAGAAWAISPLLWGQATIVEVYTLNALFFVALLWLAWRWGEGAESGAAGREWLAAAGLVLGFGLGNHLTLALIVPGLVGWIWAKGRDRCSLPRDLLAAGAGLLIGLLVYAYLPLAAHSGSPINWGDPRTPHRFLWVVTGCLYAGMAFGLPLAQVPGRLLGWATTTVSQFLPWGLLLALGGLGWLQLRQRTWWAVTLLIWLTFTVYAVGYNSTDSDAYLIPAFAVMALWLAEGLARFLAALARLDLPHLRLAPAVLVALLAALALVAAPALWRWGDYDPAAGWSAWAVSMAANDAAPNAVILTASDQDTFALWYSVYGLKERNDVAIVNVNLYGYEWYRRALAETHSFLLPSVDPPAPIETLIARWLVERPVYAAENVGLPLQLGEPVPPAAVLWPVTGLTQ